MTPSRRRSKKPGTEQLELFPPAGYLTVDDVARLLGVPKSFIYRRTCRGHSDGLPSYRFGGHLRFRPDDIEDWIAKHRRDPVVTEPFAILAAQRRSSRHSFRASTESARGRRK